MPGLLADTHSVIWYFQDRGRLSAAALAEMEKSVQSGEPILLSAISLVEIAYLVDRGRLPVEAMTSFDDQINRGDAAVRVAPVDALVANAVRRVPRDAVPDMPDRIIAATALHLGVPLVSRDRRIRASGLEVIW
jgi:PIN domain nuclease of toxin-antitoxin system